MEEIYNLLSNLLERIENIYDEDEFDTRTLSEIKNKLKVYNKQFFAKNDDFESMIDEVFISRENYNEYITAKEHIRGVIIAMLDYLELQNNNYFNLKDREERLKKSIEELENESIKASSEAEKIKQIREELNKQSENIQKQTQRLLNEEEKLNEFKTKLDLLDNQVDFKAYSENNKKNAQFWIAITLLLLIALTITVISNLSDRNLFSEIVTKVTADLKKQKLSQNLIDNTIYFTFAKVLFTKLLLYSILFMGIKISLKNYHSQMHNHIINAHKSNSLKKCFEYNECS